MNDAIQRNFTFLAYGLITAWAVLVGLSDNVLKPLLMGRGSKTPMLILFMGSLGGFIVGGILGLFVGAVILSLGYTVFMAWIGDVNGEGEPGSSPRSP